MKDLVKELNNIKAQSENIMSMTDEGIRERMKEWDTREWKKGMNEKSSLRIYRKWRTEIGGQEKIYDNRQTSEILYKCRTNTLKLKDRNRFRNEETKCEMCEEEKEDLKHFLLWCPAYSDVRQKNIKLQQPYKEEEDDIIGELLFGNENIEETKITIHKFWKIREKKMKEQ